MSLKDQCFNIPIRNKVIIDEDAVNKIKSHFYKLFRNKKRFGENAFSKDEKLPFELYFGLAWKKRKSMCMNLTSRAKDNLERVKEILSKLKDDDLKIDENISLTKPTEIEACNFERFKAKKGEKLWTKLEHNGPYFKHILEPYQSIGAGIKYEGKMLKLTPEEEEVAVFYARRIITERTSVKKFLDKAQFNQNFFNDFKEYLTPEHRKLIKDFKKLDFTPLVKRLDELKEEKEEAKKAKSPEEKETEKIKKLEQKLNYSFAYVDGVKKEIRNPSVEIAGLYIGQGNILTSKGKIKSHTYPEDVVINASKGDAPDPPKGYKWKDVVNDPTAAWIAKYKDSITGKDKYIFLAESSDLFKFEKARKLNKHISEIEKKINELLKSSSEREKQIGTVMYLIKNFGIRAGSSETEDGGDDKTEKVVGASTLMKQNISLEGNNKVELKFFGKDSVFYNNVLDVSKVVYENIKSFLKGKKDADLLFDLTSASEVNKYLKAIDRDFTAKVFRTRLASSMMYEGLKKLKKYKKGISDDEKVKDFNEVNKEVAIKLNHKKGITDAQKASIAKDEKALKDLKKEIKDEENKDKKEKLEKKYQDKKLKLDIKKQNLGIALETSKKNYIDPRIVKAWAESVDLPVNKIYKTKALEKHFKWALEDEEFNVDWDYLETPLDCIVGDDLSPKEEGEEVKKSDKKKSPAKTKKEKKDKVKIAKEHLQKVKDNILEELVESDKEGEDKEEEEEEDEEEEDEDDEDRPLGEIKKKVKKEKISRAKKSPSKVSLKEKVITPSLESQRENKIIQAFCKKPTLYGWRQLSETTRETFFLLSQKVKEGNQGNKEVASKILEIIKEESQIEIKDYSEKSFVVRGGKTLKLKEKLKELGGRFNKFLTGGAGWIFPITKKEEVRKLLEL